MKTMIFNPFERYSENTLIVFGAMFLLLGSLIGTYCNSNFDGALDLHFSNYQSTFIELVMENIINVVVMALCLFAAGKIINRKTRVIDLVSAALISRIPIYFVSLFNITQVLSIGQSEDLHEVMTFAQENMTFLVIMSIFMIFAIIWMFALLFNGYKTSTNGKGPKSIILFIVGVLVAEVISKLIIYKTIL